MVGPKDTAWPHGAQAVDGALVDGLIGPNRHDISRVGHHVLERRYEIDLGVGRERRCRRAAFLVAGKA